MHAPTLGYVRRLLTEGNSIRSIVDLPHNTFRPHCNAKTCLIVLQKGVPQQATVTMATPLQIGHDHKGQELRRPDEKETVWNDMEQVLQELEHVDAEANQFVQTHDAESLDLDMLVPRYYNNRLEVSDASDHLQYMALGDLVDEKVLKYFPGHGSPPARHKGEGNVPYVRVSDVVNWELYRNPVAGIPEHVYNEYVLKRQNSHVPRQEDVLFVSRGSYRIGTVAMASERDSKVILTRELLTFRVAENDYGLTSFNLLAILSSNVVQRQLYPLICYDTTLPTIGGRWREIQIPIWHSQERMERVSERTKQVLEDKWKAQRSVEELANEMKSSLVT